jgi:hypothetical protein
MAVSCYECDYLLRCLEEQYLLSGGEVSWLLEGLTAVDPKLRALGPLNEVLCYKPWALTTEMLEGVLNSEPALKWSVQELFHAGAILSHYHSLCSLVFGQGLTEERDMALSFE